MPMLNNSDVTSTPMFPGVSRKILSDGERMMLVEVLLDANSTVPEHTHPHEQTGYLASGRVRFRIGAETAELGQGDSWMIPSGVPHEVTALADSVAIDIFSPPREDFR